MSDTVVLNPDDIRVTRLQSLFERAGMETAIDSDGDLVVTSGVTCYAVPTRACDRIQLLSFVGIRDEVERDTKLDFVNRVNNRVSTIRARVNPKEKVLFDYHIPVDGGITEDALVLATQFFLKAIAYAATECDEDNIVR